MARNIGQYQLIILNFWMLTMIKHWNIKQFYIYIIYVKNVKKQCYILQKERTPTNFHIIITFGEGETDLGMVQKICK